MSRALIAAITAVLKEKGLSDADRAHLKRWASDEVRHRRLWLRHDPQIRRAFDAARNPRRDAGGPEHEDACPQRGVASEQRHPEGREHELTKHRPIDVKVALGDRS